MAKIHQLEIKIYEYEDQKLSQEEGCSLVHCHFSLAFIT
jgi:hypothetical protein